MRKLRIILLVILCNLFIISASFPKEAGVNPAIVVSEQKENWHPNITRRENPGPLKVFVLDVGQGDSIFVEFPYGETMLVDAGSKDKVKYIVSHDGKSKEFATDDYITDFLDYYFSLKENLYKNKTIDVAVASHPDADHINYMKKILESYNVNWYIDNGQPGPGKGKRTAKDGSYYSLMEEVLKKDNEDKLDYVVIHEDNKEFEQNGFLDFTNIIHFKDSKIYILGSYKADKYKKNNNSIVMKIVNGSTSILLTGDSEGENISYENDYVKADTEKSEENRIYKRLKNKDRLDMLNSDVLKVGHHGSANTASSLYLSKVAPKISVISVGDYKISSEATRFRHPRLVTVKRLNDYTSETIKSHTILAFPETDNTKKSRRKQNFVAKNMRVTSFATEKAIYTTADEHILDGGKIAKLGDIIIILDGAKVTKE